VGCSRFVAVRSVALADRALAAAALVLVACGTDADAPVGDGSGGSGDPSVVDAQVTIGTGFRAYTPVDAGDTLDFVYGIQGGFHLWGAFQSTGLVAGDAEIDFTLVHAGEVIATASYDDRLRDEDGDGVIEYSAVSVVVTPAFQDRLVIPESILGEDDRLSNLPGADFREGDATLSLRVRDVAGTVTESTLDIRVRCCTI
jgi:hypothetical protein